MNNKNELSERERRLKILLGKMTTNLVPPQDDTGDPLNIMQAGNTINLLLREQYIPEAREMALKELNKHPGEPRFLKILMLIEGIEMPDGSYEKAKEYGKDALMVSLEKNNNVHISATLNNFGLISVNQGDYITAEVFFRLALYFGPNRFAPMRNLAGLLSELDRLDESMLWVKKIIDSIPSALQKEEVISFLTMERSMHNLRTKHKEFQKILNRLN